MGNLVKIHGPGMGNLDKNFGPGGYVGQRIERRIMKSAMVLL